MSALKVIVCVNVRFVNHRQPGGADKLTGVPGDITFWAECPCIWRWFPAWPRRLLHQWTATWNLWGKGRKTPTKATQIICFYIFKNSVFQHSCVLEILAASWCDFLLSFFFCPTSRCQHRVTSGLIRESVAQWVISLLTAPRHASANVRQCQVCREKWSNYTYLV